MRTVAAERTQNQPARPPARTRFGRMVRAVDSYLDDIIGV